MVNEEQARKLLHQAGDTIDVNPTAAHVALPDRMRWPILVATAATVALIATLAVWLVGGAQDDATPPANSPSQTPVKEPDFTAGEIPPVFGLSQELATDRLLEAGYKVDVREKSTFCTPDRTVVGSTPAQGKPLEPGKRVRLAVSTSTMLTGCTGNNFDLVWPLVIFALDSSRPPEFAEEVRLRVGSKETVLTRDEARDPASWEICNPDGTCASPLQTLSEEAAASDDDVRLGAPMGFWPDHCASAPAREELYAAVSVEPSGLGPCPQVWVRTTSSGIDSVLLQPTSDQSSQRPSATLAPQAESAARQFVEFAQGVGDPPEFAPSVAIPQTHEPSGYVEVDAQLARQPDTWAMCSGGGSGPCDASTLEDVSQLADAYVTDDRPCPDAGPKPERLDDLMPVWIGGAESWTCLDAGTFGWTVYLDDEFRIAGVVPDRPM